MSHTVTITRVPDDESDDTEYEFGGTHDSNCETFRECRKTWHRHPTGDHDSEWGTKRAGPHQFIDGTWMVPDGACALHYVFENEGPSEALGGIDVGETRNVDTEWDGDSWALVVLGLVPTLDVVQS